MSPLRWLFLTTLACLISSINAAPSESTIVLPQRGWNFTFSLNVDKNSDDIYFRLISSADYSWAAVGIGSQMKGSLMFVAYQGKNSTGITLSPRIALGNVEPNYASGINVNQEPGSGTLNNRFVVNARCTNCRSWTGGSLNVTSEEQPFIYAWGPTWQDISTDSFSANMQRHSSFGFFDMDMTQASSGDTGVPEGTKTSGAKVGNPHHDFNVALFAHLLFTLGSIVLLLPLGIFFVRVIGKVKLHYIIQTFALVIIIIGGGTGIQLSNLFNLTRNFRTSHQILGLVLIGLLMVQFFLGYFHHRAYLRTQRRNVYSHVHTWHGRLLIISGALNGFLGLKLAGRPSLGYLIVLLLIVALYIAVYFMFWSRIRRKGGAHNTPRAGNFRDNDPGSFENSQTDIPLADHAAPPAYQEDYVPPPLDPPPIRS